MKNKHEKIIGTLHCTIAIIIYLCYYITRKDLDMKKNKILNCTIVLILSLLLVQCTTDKKRIHMELLKTAAEWNRSTPVVINHNIRFDSLGVTNENVFQYYYTITNIENPKELISLHKEEMMEEIDKVFPTDRSVQFFVKNKVIMEYIYRDTMQNVVDVITVDTGKFKVK